VVSSYDIIGFVHSFFIILQLEIDCNLNNLAFLCEKRMSKAHWPWVGPQKALSGLFGMERTGEIGS
jgi:hypothetical protein